MDLDLEKEIQTLITERLVQFHEALVERGQIPRSTPGFGTTDDCKVDQVSGANPSQQQPG